MPISHKTLCISSIFFSIETFNFSTCVVLFCSGQIVTSLNMPFHSFQGHPLLINILQQWAHSVKWHLLQLLATWFCTRYNLCTSSHILFFVCHDINHTLQEAAIGGKVWQLDCIYPTFDKRTFQDWICCLAVIKAKLGKTSDIPNTWGNKLIPLLLVQDVSVKVELIFTFVGSMDKGAASDVPTTGKTGINGGGEIHLATSVITSMEIHYLSLS